MEIAKIQVSGVNAQTVSCEVIPAGIIGATVAFEYTDAMWAGLTKTVVFKGCCTKDILSAGSSVTIPAEVVAKPGTRIQVGVYGVDAEGNIAIPTLWASLGVTKDATDPSGDESTDPQLPVWAQIQAQIGDLDKLDTEAKENLVAAINEALTKGGGTVDEAEIQQIVADYLTANPPEPGVDGEDGKSAYEIAVDNGFEGTEAEWIASLKGDPGKDGADGTPGADGSDYVLTDSDKTEIAELAAGMVEVPEGATIQPLTFTGAVEATYDGSEAVNVEISQGGGGSSEDAEELVVVAEGGETFIGFSYEELGMADCFDCKAFQVWGHNLGYASETLTGDLDACFKLNDGTYYYGVVFKASKAVRKDDTSDPNVFTSTKCVIPVRYTEKSVANRRKELPVIGYSSVNVSISVPVIAHTYVMPTQYNSGFYIWAGSTDATWIKGSTFHVKIWR